jgi:hypothetical protein
VNPLRRVFRSDSGEVLDEGLFLVGRGGVVLDVDVTDVPLDGLGRLALIEHQVVERHHRLLVLVQAIGHASQLHGKGSEKKYNGLRRHAV